VGSSGALSSGYASLPEFRAAASGDVLWPSNLTYTGTGLLVLNELVVVPFFTPRAVSMANLGLEVTTIGTAGAVVRLGMYYGTLDAPTTLAIDAGTIVATSTGFKEVAAGFANLSGAFWLAAVAQVAASTVRVINGSPMHPPASIAAPENAAGLKHNAAVAGALPATFVNDNAASPVGRCAAVAVRVA
jgi:hypothetical protein